MSVNQAWQGKRYKTKKYNKYEKDILLMLPPLQIPSGKLNIKLEVGFSNRASDIDNVIKPFLDILQKKYSFNDNKVYKLSIKKQIVKRGSDYISFLIKELE